MTVPKLISQWLYKIVSFYIFNSFQDSIYVYCIYIISIFLSALQFFLCPSHSSNYESFILYS